jgi:hypothetical protein
MMSDTSIWPKEVPDLDITVHNATFCYKLGRRILRCSPPHPSLDTYNYMEFRC